MAKKKVHYHNPLLIMRSRKYLFTGCVGVTRNGLCKFSDDFFSFYAGFIIILDAFRLGFFRPRDIILRFTMDPEIIALMKISFNFDSPFMSLRDVENFLNHLAYFSVDYPLSDAVVHSCKIFRDFDDLVVDMRNLLINQ